RSSTFSPTFNGSAAKTLPAETRCRPLTRMSLTTKDSALASAIRRAAIAAGSRRFMKSLFKTDYVTAERQNCGSQPPQIIEQGQQHDPYDQRDADLHPPGLDLFQPRLYSCTFLEADEQVSDIKLGNWHQVENGMAN